CVLTICRRGTRGNNRAGRLIGGNESAQFFGDFSWGGPAHAVSSGVFSGLVPSELSYAAR
ncbi:MAG: hypothetical protein WA618_06665, partial [Terriglobales bacterium]